MFTVSEEAAVAIRTAYDEGGEMSAATGTVANRPRRNGRTLDASMSYRINVNPNSRPLSDHPSVTLKALLTTFGVRIASAMPWSVTQPRSLPKPLLDGG
jgi:hypothetical protein